MLCMVLVTFPPPRIAYQEIVGPCCEVKPGGHGPFTPPPGSSTLLCIAYSVLITHAWLQLGAMGTSAHSRVLTFKKLLKCMEPISSQHAQSSELLCQINVEFDDIILYCEFCAIDTCDLNWQSNRDNLIISTLVLALLSLLFVFMVLLVARNSREKVSNKLADNLL